MAIKKISEFTSGIPTTNDKILFEQSGEGKSTTIGNAVNTCSLSYEEIMASTDLSGKIPSAIAMKYIGNYLNSLNVLKSNLDYEFDLDNLDLYPKAQGVLQFKSFGAPSVGTKPFEDGHLLTFVWRNNPDNKRLSQIAVEDDTYGIKTRYYRNGVWSAWKSITIS